MLWVAIFLIIVTLTALVSCGVLYVLFLRSSDGAWRSQVLDLHATGLRFHQELQNGLSQLQRETEDEERCLRDSAWQSFLKTVSVRELANYPGIGPGTIDRLQGAGFSTVAHLQRASINIHGLGEKRLADISNAVRALTRQVSSRFEAGSCPESRDLADGIKELRARMVDHQVRMRTRQAGAKRFLDEMAPLVAVANSVSFWNHIWAPNESVVPLELLEARFPDLQTCIRNAEKSARQVPVVAAVKTSPWQPVDEPAKAAHVQPIPVATPIERDVGVPVWKAVSMPATDGSSAKRPMPVAAKAFISSPATPAEPERKSDLMEWIVPLLFAVARSDGRIARKEKEIIEQYVAQQCGNDAARFNRAKAWCAHYETATIEVDHCLQRIAKRDSLAERRSLLDLAMRIADAAGPRNERESLILERIARAFGLPVDDFVQPQDDIGLPPPSRAVETSSAIPASKPLGAPTSPRSVSVPTPREEQLRILEINPGTPVSADLVRRQYHLLSDKFAAEKFAGGGAEFAATARAAVRTAAEALLAQWNEKVELAATETQVQEMRHNPDLDAMFGSS